MQEFIIDLNKKITVTDARDFGGCVTGWKLFVEQHGYVWKTVIKEGLTAQQLIDTGDLMAINLVKFVMERDNVRR